MFPTTHDITPAILTPYFTVLEKMLAAGNRVLIVSKPHLECIQKICDGLKTYHEQMLFRFTITARDDSILKFWEPNAPVYQERVSSLEYAFGHGFETSVSIEPMLDSQHIEDLVRDLAPYVTDSIWIGKMNQIRVRVKADGAETEAAIERIEAGQTDERIKDIYAMLKGHPLIKWKDSVKQVVGLDLAQEPGLDK
jgi:DNA repair photolyase